jgi:hypothetical protein
VVQSEPLPLSEPVAPALSERIAALKSQRATLPEPPPDLWGTVDALMKQANRVGYDPDMVTPERIETAKKAGLVIGRTRFKLTPDGRAKHTEWKRQERDRYLAESSLDDQINDLELEASGYFTKDQPPPEPVSQPLGTTPANAEIPANAPAPDLAKQTEVSVSSPEGPIDASANPPAVVQGSRPTRASRAGSRRGTGRGAEDALSQPNPADEHFAVALADAKRLGFTGSDDSLRAHFDQKYAEAEQLLSDYNAELDANGPRQILHDIAKLGGLGDDAGMPGEIRNLWEASPGFKPGKLSQKSSAYLAGKRNPTGSLGGVTSVLRAGPAKWSGQRDAKGGWSLDSMAEQLREIGYTDIKGPNELYDAIDAALSDKTKRPTVAMALKQAGIDPEQRYWEAIEEARAKQDESGDTSFDVNEFGEAQPRLPGAESVRDQNIPTPEVAELPFSLNAPKAKPGKASPEPGLYDKGKAEFEAKKAAPKAKKIKQEAILQEVYRPGAIVQSYYGHDRVISYTPPSKDKGWSVEVIAVNPDGSPIPGERPRVHFTEPTKADIRAAIKRLSPDQPKPQARSASRGQTLGRSLADLANYRPEAESGTRS